MSAQVEVFVAEPILNADRILAEWEADRDVADGALISGPELDAIEERERRLVEAFDRAVDEAFFGRPGIV